MSDTTDEPIRRSLGSAYSVEGSGPAELPRALESRHADANQDLGGGSGVSRPRTERSHLRFGLFGAAALLLLGVVVWAAVVDRQPDAPEVVADGAPASPPAAWAELTTDGLPVLVNVSLDRVGSALVVSGTTAESTDEETSGAVYALADGAPSWERMPDPPLGHFDLVAAGDRLVVVGVADSSEPPAVLWSVLDLDEDKWTEPEQVPGTEVRETRAGFAGDIGLGRQFEGAQLVWTGSHVIDTHHGVAIDPEGLSAQAIAVPPDLENFHHLAGATPVWTGESVVLSTWTRLPGLTWTGDGQSFDVVPGLPDDLAGDEVLPASAAAVDGSLYLSSGLAASGTNVVRLDADLEYWSEIPTLPVPSDPLCGWELARLGDQLVAQGCREAQGGRIARGDAWMWDGQDWIGLGAPKRDLACCEPPGLAATGERIVLGARVVELSASPTTAQPFYFASLSSGS